MGRLIDADEYEKRIKPYDTEDVMDKALYNFAHTKLISTPTARPKGKWILWENQRQEDIDNGNYQYTCSVCGHGDLHAKTQRVPFCWWCGSEMENDNE